MGIDDAEEKLKSWGFRPVYEKSSEGIEKRLDNARVLAAINRSIGPTVLAMLDELWAEVERLRALVQSGYREGFVDCMYYTDPSTEKDLAWDCSESKKQLG